MWPSWGESVRCLILQAVEKAEMEAHFCHNLFSFFAGGMNRSVIPIIADVFRIMCQFKYELG